LNQIEGPGERCKFSQRGLERKSNLVHARAVRKPLVAIMLSILKCMFYSKSIAEGGGCFDTPISPCLCPSFQTFDKAALYRFYLNSCYMLTNCVCLSRRTPDGARGICGDRRQVQDVPEGVSTALV